MAHHPRPAHRIRSALRLGRDHSPSPLRASYRRRLLPARRRIKNKNLRRHRSLLRAHPARIPYPSSRRHTLRHLLRPRWNHPHRCAARNHLPGERRLPHRVACPQLEPRRRAKTSRPNLCRRKLSPEAHLRRLRLRKPGRHRDSLSGTYQLTNARQDYYKSFEIEARRTFTNGYTLFASYTRSSATTNAAIDYNPTVSMLGPQQSGPLPWNTPNRLISWGWLPLPLPRSSKRTGTSSTP